MYDIVMYSEGEKNCIYAALIYCWISLLKPF